MCHRSVQEIIYRGSVVMVWWRLILLYMRLATYSLSSSVCGSPTGHWWVQSYKDVARWFLERQRSRSGHLQILQWIELADSIFDFFDLVLFTGFPKECSKHLRGIPRNSWIYPIFFHHLGPGAGCPWEHADSWLAQSTKATIYALPGQ